MEPTTATFAHTLPIRRRSSISIADNMPHLGHQQQQHPVSRHAIPRRNTLTDKMPDLSPAHLNMVPPSPPMSPAPESPVSSSSSASCRSSLASSGSRLQRALALRAERTIQLLLQGYSSLDVPTLLATLSADFTHRVLPASLAMPPRGIDAFAQHATGIFSVFEKFAMIPEETFTDLAKGIVTIHARMEGILKSKPQPQPGTAVEAPKIVEWKNECVMMIKLSADGSQVVEITEFVDSHKAMEMRQRHAPKNFDGPNTNTATAQKGRMGVWSHVALSFSRFGLAMGATGVAGLRAARWAGGSILLTCVAARTFWGVKRWMNGN